MRIFTLFTAASAALTVSALLFCVPASAATPDMLTRQAHVSYSDLDLSIPADRATLQHRIHQAASTVCAVEQDDVASRIASAQCHRQAVADATSRMDTILAAAENGKRVALR